MALPSSGQITWEQIRAEFGGGYPIYAHQYYRGGGRVPNTPVNAGVPTSGQIAASNFHGAANYTNVGASKNADAFGSHNYTPPPAGPTSVSIATNNVTISGSGGTGSYSYSWSHISGDVFSHTATAATTSFTISGVGRNQTRSAIYRCTVSDGTSSAYVDVTVSVTYNYFL